MPSKEFEKYLNKDLNAQDKDTLAQLNEQSQNVDQLPDTNSHTPAPEDAGKKISGIEDTGKKDALSKYNIRQHDEVVEAGKTLQEKGLQQDQDQER